MKRTLIIVLAVSSAFLFTRSSIVFTRSINDRYAYSWGLPLMLFCISFLKVAWTRERFKSLESTIVAMVKSRFPGAVEKWYRRAVDRMYDSGKCLVTSFVFAPIIAFVAWSVGWGFWNSDPVLKWFDYVSMVAMFSAAASSQWPFACISAFVIRLGRKSLLIDFLAHSEDNIVSIGKFMLKIALGAVVLTFFAYVSLIIAPARVGLGAYFVLCSVMIWAFAWFFLTQFNLHQCMARKKRDHVRAIARRLNNQIEICVTNPSESNFRIYKSLQEIYGQICSFPEWPFRAQNVLTLTTSVALPISIALLNLLWNN